VEQGGGGKRAGMREQEEGREESICDVGDGNKRADFRELCEHKVTVATHLCPWAATCRSLQLDLSRGIRPYHP